MGNSNQGTTNPCKRFRYDNSAGYTGTVPAGITTANTVGRVREVLTDVCVTGNDATLTDEWFSYSPRGELTDVYELTPHSGTNYYYHTTAAYWPTGTLETLSGIPGVPTLNYGASGAGLDGEGRLTQVTASSGMNPVTSVAYSTTSTTNPLGALTGVTFGSADSDSFSSDPNTGRMKGYTFTVNSQTDVGALTWNTNGTLSKLVITDGITGTNDSQTCNYLYDDLQRVSSSSCGALWSQTFTYDSFGNITKTGNSSFTPGYSLTQNQFTSIPGRTVSYDGNGNLLTDNLNTYTWDVYGNMSTVNGGAVAATYDGLGRMVEKNVGGVYSAIVYAPTGDKVAVVATASQTLSFGYIKLPGGAKAVYQASGLAYFRHSDWLGSSRLASTPSRTVYSSAAYAPFGEAYSTSFTNELSFTGQNEDTVSSLYDFPARRYSQSQGRWISPDPLGRGAVSLTNPQTWNRYAYVSNNPLRAVDSTGQEQDICGTDDVTCIFGGDGGGGAVGDDDDSSGGLGNDPNCDVDACVTADAPSDLQTQDSNIACNTLAPNAPAGSGASVAANVTATSSAFINDPIGTGAASWWLDQVKPGGSWDYRAHYGNTFDNSAFGNFNFGATCAAMDFSLSTCQSGAGAVDDWNAVKNVAGELWTGQPLTWTAGPGIPFIHATTVNGQPTYGDQTNAAENPMVTQGYDYAQQGCTE